MKLNHKIENQFQCESCSFKTNRKDYLKTHEQTVHENSRKYSCFKCEYKAKSNYHLKRHVKLVHTKDLVDERLKNEKIPCHKCDYYSSTRMDHLTLHIQAVHENIMYRLSQNYVYQNKP